MSDERITVRVTDNDSTIKVLVYSKRPDRIEVMLGEGNHSVKCELTPTANGIGLPARRWAARSSTSVPCSRWPRKSSWRTKITAIRVGADRPGSTTNL